MQKLAINTTASLLLPGSAEIETEGNFEIFRNAVPANIKMIEGMLYLEPENRDLLLLTMKSYAGYAYVVNETDLLIDQLSGQSVEESFSYLQSLLNYSKAVEYGYRLLATYGLQNADLVQVFRQPNGINNLLDEHLGNHEKSREAIFVLAQSLGGLINLQRKNLGLMAQLPLVKGLFDWTCQKDPEQHFGGCDQFYGAYEAGRPQLLGGNPKLGKEIFLKRIERAPYNLFQRVGFLQFYAIPQMDEAAYRGQEKFLTEAQKQFKESLIYTPLLKSSKNPFFELPPRLRLYNAVAIKRFEIMQRYKKKYFN
jgi:hypothetical protein